MKAKGKALALLALTALLASCGELGSSTADWTVVVGGSSEASSKASSAKTDGASGRTDGTVGVFFRGLASVDIIYGTTVELGGFVSYNSRDYRAQAMFPPLDSSDPGGFPRLTPRTSGDGIGSYYCTFEFVGWTDSPVPEGAVSTISASEAKSFVSATEKAVTKDTSFWPVFAETLYNNRFSITFKALGNTIGGFYGRYGVVNRVPNDIIAAANDVAAAAGKRFTGSWEPKNGSPSLAEPLCPSVGLSFSGLEYNASFM